MTTPQGAHVEVEGRGELLNLCANNYLGLADHPAVVAAAHEALDRWGYGMASVRFICGTQELHRSSRSGSRAFLGTEDTILFGSCFDANGGLFEALLGEEDAVISDELNHASIIDGIRLCKAQRLRYANGDMDELEARLEEAARRAPPADRDRRRLLDGRLPRPARRDLRPRRAPRRARDGRRLPRRRLRRARRPRHARASRRRSTGSTSSPARSARRSAARAAATSPAGARSSSCCASARGPTCSRTASPRRSSPRASRALELIESSARAARPAAREHRALPRRA